MSSDGHAHDTIPFCDHHSLEASNKDFRKQNGKQLGHYNQGLKEDIAFLRKWSFVPGEPSPSSDLIIYTRDGSKFHAHTLILADGSDVFRAMFELDLKEKRTGKVLIEDVGGESVKSFLKFLYTAQLSHEDMNANYKELLKLAHLYHVKLLSQKLDVFIAKHVVTKEKVVEVLKMAHMYEMERTKEGAHKIIADDWELVEKMDGHPWMAFDFSKYLVHRLKRGSIE